VHYPQQFLDKKLFHHRKTQGTSTSTTFEATRCRCRFSFSCLRSLLTISKTKYILATLFCGVNSPRKKLTANCTKRLSCFFYYISASVLHQKALPEIEMPSCDFQPEPYKVLLYNNFMLEN